MGGKDYGRDFHRGRIVPDIEKYYLTAINETVLRNFQLAYPELTAHRLLASAAGFFKSDNIFPDLFPHMSVKVQPHVA